MKTAERAHTPKELWESVKLDPSYNKALEQIDQELQYWPNFLKHKCKQRFTRLRQILIKRKKMKLEGRAEYKVVSHKAERRENARYIKAEKSAVLENHIADELLKNLKNGKYDSIYNIDHKAFNLVLEKENAISSAQLDEEFNEDDYDKGYIDEFSDEEEEEEGEEEGEGYKEGSEDDEDKEGKINDKEIDDIFNNSKTDTKANSKKGKKIGKKRKRGIEVEKEYENTSKNVNYNMNTNTNNDDLEDYL